MMLLSTTHTLDGKNIKEYKGIVFGEAIIGANVFRDLLASIKDIVGGRLGTYEKVLAEARDTAVNEMWNNAQNKGANAVIGIDVDYEVVGAKGSMLMVSVSGTAVIVE